MAVAGFAFSLRQPVVPRDLDAFGHVNNSVFLVYAENARVAYLRQVVGARSLSEIRNIMAALTIEFREQVCFGEELEIGVRVERLGTKSFELAYRMQRRDGAVAAELTSTQVMFDFEAGRPIEVPPAWRAAIEAHDGLA